MPELSSLVQSRLYSPKASKMPFRERVKRAFTRRDSSDGSGLSSRKESNYTVYKPGEAMPRPKYRRPVDPEHKASLEAFEMGTKKVEKRRSIRSLASLYSPMGSRLMSRNASRQSSRAPSRAPSRGPSRGPSRQSSLSGGTPARPGFSRGKSHIAQVVENADEAEDFANVGGPSRLATRPPSPSRSGPRSGHMSPTPRGSAHDSAHAYLSTGRRKRAETAHDHVPFSAEEIHNALLRKVTNRDEVHISPDETSPA